MIERNSSQSSKFKPESKEIHEIIAVEAARMVFRPVDPSIVAYKCENQPTRNYLT